METNTSIETEAKTPAVAPATATPTAVAPAPTEANPATEELTPAERGQFSTVIPPGVPGVDRPYTPFEDVKTYADHDFVVADGVKVYRSSDMRYFISVDAEAGKVIIGDPSKPFQVISRDEDPEDYTAKVSQYQRHQKTCEDFGITELYGQNLHYLWDGITVLSAIVFLDDKSEADDAILITRFARSDNQISIDHVTYEWTYSLGLQNKKLLKRYIDDILSLSTRKWNDVLRLYAEVTGKPYTGKVV